MEGGSVNDRVDKVHDEMMAQGQSATQQQKPQMQETHIAPGKSLNSPHIF